MIDFPHKTKIPQQHAQIVSRPRLLEGMRNIDKQRLLTLIAPIGYGKTTLLIDFASTVSLPVAWYSVDTDDQDPWAFLHYLVAAIERCVPGALTQTSVMLASHTALFEDARTTLIQELQALTDDVIVIFDDWHLVDLVIDISNLVSTLLRHCPKLHLILATQHELHIPHLMQVSGHQQVSRFVEAHLRFTSAEVTALLETLDQRGMPWEQTLALVTQTDGWIMGITVLLRALGLSTTHWPACAACTTQQLMQQHRADLPVLLHNPVISGDDGHTMITATTQAIGLPVSISAPCVGCVDQEFYSFLAVHILNQQPPALRAFMLEVALLDNITIEQCNAIFTRDDAASLLDTMLNQHLFIYKIQAGVFRYNPLFRAFLLMYYRTMDSLRYRAHARQVADAYVAQEQWLCAFAVYTTLGDVQAAQRIVTVSGSQLLAQGDLETLEQWFSLLPEHQLDTPLLCLKARVLVYRGHYTAAHIISDLAAKHMRPEDEPVVILLQAFLAILAGRYEYARNLAQHVFAQTEAQRVAKLHTLALCHYHLKRIHQALDELREALTLARQIDDRGTLAQIYYDLGRCYQAVGQLHDAESSYNYAEDYWASINNHYLRALSLSAKGSVLRFRGYYHESHAVLSTALQLSRDAAVPFIQAEVLFELGKLYSDVWNGEQAIANYNEARQLGSGMPALQSRLELARAHLLIRQKNYAAATNAMRQISACTRQHDPATVWLLQGRMNCGQGNVTQAAVCLRQALRHTDPVERPVDRVYAHLLEAQIADQRVPMDSNALVDALDSALHVADQIGDDTFLVVETRSMRNLLRHALTVGWFPATDLLQRQQDINIAARALQVDSDKPVVVVRTLGHEYVQVNGQTIEIGWRKAREIFYYLLCHPDGVPPDTLCEAIWPELPPKRGRDTLWSAIHLLRSHLPDHCIVLHGRQVYRLNRTDIQIDYDVERFLDLLDTQVDSEALFDALDLYHGPYLRWSDTPWTVSVRTKLEQRYLQALRQASTDCERRGAHLEALNFYRCILELDQLDESIHARVMNCQIELGNRAAAVEQYCTLRDILKQELGLDPDPNSEAEHLYYNLLTPA